MEHIQEVGVWSNRHLLRAQARDRRMGDRAWNCDRGHGHSRHDVVAQHSAL